MGKGIDFTLLQDVWNPAPWINLGDWSKTQDYRNACHHLALELGKFINLQAEDSLLELACGYGAGLWLWQESFGNKSCVALEFRKECLKFLENEAPKNLVRLIPSKADYFFLEQLSQHSQIDEEFDAILCVDSAYHFPFLQDFLQTSIRILNPKGRLGFHFLCLNSQKKISPLLKKIFDLVDVHADGFRTENELIVDMKQHGFKEVELLDLSDRVLEGFSKFLERRSKELKWKSKIKPAWWKIKATSWICRRVMFEGSLKYMMVRGTI